METKYSPFSVTSVLRHDSFAPNRGHFRSVRAHQAVSYPPATMSLAERLAGLISFLVLSILLAMFFMLLFSIKNSSLRRQGHLVALFFVVDLSHVKNSYVNATTMMGLLSLDVNRTKTPMRQCLWLAIFDSK